MSDVKDILEIEQASTGTPTKEAIVAGNKVNYWIEENFIQTMRQIKTISIQHYFWINLLNFREQCIIG